MNDCFVNGVFRDILNQFVIIYLDDILIFSKNHNQHKDHFWLILERLQKYELYIKLEEGTFAQPSTEFLGYIISPRGIQMDPRKVEAIHNWQHPVPHPGVAVFSGICKLLSKIHFKFIGANHSFELPSLQVCQVCLVPQGTASLSSPQDHLCNHSPLAHSDPTQPFMVEADASHEALGAVLSQKFRPQLIQHPCVYCLYKLTPVERNYKILQKTAYQSAFEE